VYENNFIFIFKRAIKNFNNAIKSDPVYLRAYLCRAQAYRCIHDVTLLYSIKITNLISMKFFFKLKRAYIDYTKAIHLDPLNTQVYIYRVRYFKILIKQIENKNL